MYSANLCDQFFSAALPLKPLVTWAGSACSVTVAVPPAPAIRGVAIESVGVSLELPDGSVRQADAVAVAGTPLWTATFPASAFAVSGTVAQGMTVTLSGRDERSAERVWIVAKGDIEVRSGDASPSPGGSFVLVKLRTEAPAHPVDGDAYVSEGKLYIYQGGAWAEIGGPSVVVDPTLTQPGAAADAKATGDALAQKRGLGDLAVYAPSFSEWVFTPLTEGAYLIGGPDWIATESDFNESPYHSGGMWQGAGWYCDYGIEGSGAGSFYLGGTQDATELTRASDFTLTRTVTAWTPASPADALAKTSQLPTVPSAYASTPAMDGAGSAGSSTAWARGDHVHPSDTSRAAKTDLPYPFVPIVVEQGVATVTPRTVATYTAGTTAASFSIAIGTGTTGSARDCVLVVDCTAADAVAPTVTWPSNFHPRGDAEEIAPVAGARNVFYISEYATGQFVVGGWHEEVA